MGERSLLLCWVVENDKLGVLVPDRKIPYFLGDRIVNSGSKATAFQTALNYTKKNVKLNDRCLSLLALLSVACVAPNRLYAFGFTDIDSDGLTCIQVARLSGYKSFRGDNRDKPEKLAKAIWNNFSQTPAGVVQTHTSKLPWRISLACDPSQIDFKDDALTRIEQFLRNSLDDLPSLGTESNAHVAFEELRRLSRSATTAAAVVLSPHECGNATGVALPNVYVERTIEKALVQDITSGARGEMHVVYGEAGTGKTSLLWSIHATLSACALYEPWLLKSSMMNRNLSHEILRGALLEAQRQGKIPVLLLDTVDLLLHRDEDADRFTAFVLTAAEARCSIVMTCRPGEEAHWPAVLRAKPRPRLEGFDAEELKKAKELYIAQFYHHMDEHDKHDHVEQLDRLVAGRHAMAEIMRHPLTLRMLFHLYAPYQIPSEIDVTRLYADYWQRRVCTDTRPGNHCPTDCTDLGPAAGWLALAMLQEGDPALNEQMGGLVLRRHQVPVAHLNALVDRGILRRGDGTVEFFHQTFFEHSAARGFIEFGPAAGISLLATRMNEHPEDLLVAAVLEQSLIIGSAIARSIRPAAERTMRDLLESGRLSLQSIAVASYCRIPSPSDELKELVDAALVETVLARRMISLAPSMVEARADDLFARFDSIWRASVGRRDAWRSCQHVLDELSRLATRGGAYAEHTRRFVDQHQVRELTLEKQNDADAKRPLLAVLVALAPHDVKVWDDFVFLARGSKKDFFARILSAMSRVAAHLRQERPAHALATELADINHNDTEVNWAWGELWDAEWQLRRAPIGTMLQEVAEERNAHKHRRLLNGLARFLRQGSEADGHAAWEAYLSEPDIRRSSEWNNIVWAALMRDSSSPLPDAALAAAELIATYLARGEDLAATKRLSTQLSKAGCPPFLLERLCVDPLTQVSERWLNDDDLGPLLPAAYAFGHEAAQVAMRRLVLEPHGHGKTAIGVVGAMRAHPSVRNLETFIALVGAVESVEAVAAVLSEIPMAERDSLVSCSTMLGKLVREGFRSDQPKSRSSAARIWVELVRLSVDLSQYLENTDPRYYFDKERDPIARAWMAVMLGEIGGSDPGIDAALQCAAIAEDVNLRNKALPAWIRFLRRNGVMPPKALDVVQAATTSPTDSGRLRDAGWIVEDLVPGHMDTARRVLEEIFLSKTLESLGRQGLRNLRSTLRVPVRKWMGEASEGAASAMLSLIPRIPAELGCLVVEAAAKRSFAAVRADFARMLVDPKISAEVRGYIEEHIRIRKNVVAGARWQALERLVMKEE